MDQELVFTVEDAKADAVTNLRTVVPQRIADRSLIPTGFHLAVHASQRSSSIGQRIRLERVDKLVQRNT